MNVMLCYQQSRNILLFHGHDTKSRYVYLHHFFLNEHMDDHMLIRTCSLHACSVQTTHSWMSIWMIICSFAHARYMRAACRRLIHEGRQASACCMYVCVCVNEQKQPSTTMRSNRNSLRGTCTSLLYFVLKSCEGGGVVSLVSNTHAHIIRWHTRLSWELWSHDRTTSCSLWRYRNNPEYLYTLVK